MRRMMFVTAAMTTLVLAGCGADAAAPGPIPTEGTETGGIIPETPIPTTGEADDGPTDEDGAAGLAAPEPGQCLDLPESPDGRYLVADAGIVTIRVEDGRMLLEGAEPSVGWEHEVTEEDDDRIEVELRRDDREFDFSAELGADESPQVQVCNDDD